MNDEVRISAAQARRIHLAAQRLLTPPRARATQARLLATIAGMRLLQIDTIAVVARSPYLVLHARLGEYPLAWLDEALAQARIFECWAHEACFAPIDDLALHGGLAHARGGHWARRMAQRLYREQREAMDALLQHVRDNGPVKSADFARAPGASPGWWAWKDEKRWLEAWFALGALMVARRENFQRVYDMSERVLARSGVQSTPMATSRALHESILAAVRALGITQARWINDYFRTPGRLRDADLAPFVASGELLRLTVNGWFGAAYLHRDNAAALARARRGALRATHCALLSPFDPVVWDRERALAMFGFDYRLECYVPAAKRRHGYYSLPILCRGELVGRLDAKAHRGAGAFEVKSLHLEERVAITAQLACDVATAIVRCARWHATPRVTLARTRPRGFAALLRKALREVN